MYIRYATADVVIDSYVSVAYSCLGTFQNVALASTWLERQNGKREIDKNKPNAKTVKWQNGKLPKQTGQPS